MRVPEDLVRLLPVARRQSLRRVGQATAATAVPALPPPVQATPGLMVVRSTERRMAAPRVPNTSKLASSQRA